MHILKILTPFKPTKLSGCALWLAADRGVTTVDGYVSNWSDQSGNGNHAAQGTVANRPLYVASGQGSKPTLRFDGSDDWLSFGTMTGMPTGSTSRTAFVVCKRTDTSKRNDVFTFYPNSAANRSQWGFSFGFPNLTDVSFIFIDSTPGVAGGGSSTDSLIWCNRISATNTMSAELWKSGSKLTLTQLSGSDGTIATGYDKCAIGCSTGYVNVTRFYGDISEIIIFNRALTSYERQTVEKYLSTKYAITTTSGPEGIPDCALWLKADAGITTVDGNVSSWADQSGNGNHATQSTVANRPLYVASAQGGKPTLRFDGSDDYMSNPSASYSITHATGSTVFSVYFINSLSSPASQVPYMLGSTTYSNGKVVGYLSSGKMNVGSWGVDYSSASALYENYKPYITTGVWNPYTASLYQPFDGYLNGQKVFSANVWASSSLSAGLWLGVPNYYPSIDLAELVVFNRALTDAERIKVEQYLSSKFAITLS